jgi:hypothetical protein
MIRVAFAELLDRIAHLQRRRSAWTDATVWANRSVSCALRSKAR